MSRFSALSDVQATPDEGCEGTRTAEAERAGGMEQDSYRVMSPCIELVGGGWNGPIATTREVHVQRYAEPFSWLQIFIPELRLGHAAGLLLLQGMLLQDLLPLDSYFRLREGTKTIIGKGLHLLLKRGDFSPIARPLALKNVWLGHLDKVPDDLTRDQLLNTLMKQVH